jgi:hypothetical protein
MNTGLERLGKNVNGYFGETIDIHAVLKNCAAAARAKGWKMETLPAAPKPDLVAFSRPDPTGQSKRRIYISSGIHGDEPAGPLACVELLRDDQWCAGLDVWLCPCLNPTGFLLGRRENSEGTDLNRQYLQPKAEETLAHIAWLDRQPDFNVTFALHEDWESHGFYLYELNPDARPSLAQAIIQRVQQVCPVDHSEIIEGREAKNGIIHPSVDPRSRPQWPESFYLLTRKTRLAYTLEAPSDFPLTTRVASLVNAVHAAVTAELALPAHEPHAG